MNILTVSDGGLFTTIQDIGRYGFQKYGVPVSGPMDHFAFRAANLLVGNSEGKAGLEITILGPKLKFNETTTVAVTGADMGLLLDNKPQPRWSPIEVPPENEISFSGLKNGARAYLAIAGGLDVPKVMGSRSTYTRSQIGGFNGRALIAGDKISIQTHNGNMPLNGRIMHKNQIPNYSDHPTLRVLLGPQDDAFTRKGMATFLNSIFKVTTNSDRVGYRLEGPTIEHKGSADIISDGIPFGAVQVTGDGQPIVLMADRGTTGGYAKIATIITPDIPKMAQVAPGQFVSFRCVNMHDALAALREQEIVLEQLQNAKL